MWRERSGWERPDVRRTMGGGTGRKVGRAEHSGNEKYDRNCLGHLLSSEGHIGHKQGYSGENYIV